MRSQKDLSPKEQSAYKKARADGATHKDAMDVDVALVGVDHRLKAKGIKPVEANVIGSKLKKPASAAATRAKKK